MIKEINNKAKMSQHYEVTMAQKLGEFITNLLLEILSLVDMFSDMIIMAQFSQSTHTFWFIMISSEAREEMLP